MSPTERTHEATCGFFDRGTACTCSPRKGGPQASESVNLSSPVGMKDIFKCGSCGFAVFYYDGTNGPKYNTHEGWFHVARKPFRGCPNAKARPVQ